MEYDDADMVSLCIWMPRPVPAAASSWVRASQNQEWPGNGVAMVPKPRILYVRVLSTILRMEWKILAADHYVVGSCLWPIALPVGRKRTKSRVNGKRHPVLLRCRMIWRLLLMTKEEI